MQLNTAGSGEIKRVFLHFNLNSHDAIVRSCCEHASHQRATSGKNEVLYLKRTWTQADTLPKPVADGEYLKLLWN